MAYAATSTSANHFTSTPLPFLKSFYFHFSIASAATILDHTGDTVLTLEHHEDGGGIWHTKFINEYLRSPVGFENERLRLFLILFVVVLAFSFLFTYHSYLCRSFLFLFFIVLKIIFVIVLLMVSDDLLIPF